MARFEHLEFGPDADDRDEAAGRGAARRERERALTSADGCRRKGQYESALRFYSRASSSMTKRCWVLGPARCKC